MLEEQLVRNVVKLARYCNVLVAHFRPALTNRGWRTPVQGDGKGFPDLVLVGPGGVLFREAKSDRGSLEPDQKTWRDALVGAHADWGVWKPRDFRSGLIADEVSALRRPERTAEEKLQKVLDVLDELDAKSVVDGPLPLDQLSRREGIGIAVERIRNVLGGKSCG
jgi:hypothetical protein